MRSKVNLKHLYLLQARTHIFGEKLVSCELLVQEAVAEHHASPQVNVFLERPIMLSLAFILDTKRIEQKLRHSDKLTLFVVGPERLDGFCGVGKEVVWNSWDQSNHCLSVSFTFLNESQIIFVDSTLDPYPLMLLESLFLLDLA